ncbi:hypothetical protein [Thiothrix lacustris]|uniref:Uncharacterized protein n=1 Tax=Thiothrix lacustris TaxID=525917 RepID=A0ABY9ML53_9GAMM|nr:hypothetical protein [Thiothrix lacustris]WML89253.1 hypothetical protein RCF98_09735 [Thiothrix lacustris]WMP15891.1 hypothetical protein RCS87_10840 [Thiothrix lacustris]
MQYAPTKTIRCRGVLHTPSLGSCFGHAPKQLPGRFRLTGSTNIQALW